MHTHARTCTSFQVARISAKAQRGEGKINLHTQLRATDHLGQGGHTFSTKGQLIVNNVSFACHTVSVTATQFCHGSVKAATEKTQMNG